MSASEINSLTGVLQGPSFSAAASLGA